MSAETTAELTTTLRVLNMQSLSTEVLSTVALIVNLIGCISNAVVLTVLILARRQYGSDINTLIANQSAMDLFTCASATVIYVTMLAHGFVYRGNRVIDNIVCIALESGAFAAFGVTAGKLGLIVITLERYFSIGNQIARTISSV